MRADAEKRAGVLKAAMEKKAPREEACGHIKSFAAAEGKVVKFVTRMRRPAESRRKQSSR